METWVKAAINQWEKEKLDINSSSNLIAIAAAEDYLGFSFPNDFKQLYLVVNAFQDYEWRSNMFSLWSIERIVAEYNKGEDFIGFCDFLTCTSYLGFLKSKKEIFKRYNITDTSTNCVASSFQEAIRLINEDSALIY